MLRVDRYFPREQRRAREWTEVKKEWLWSFWSTFIHERVSWTRAPLLNYTAHHTAHHQFNKYNYGQFFTLCDRVFGTYKSPVGVVFDGGARSRDGSVEPQRRPQPQK